MEGEWGGRGGRQDPSSDREGPSLTGGAWEHHRRVRGGRGGRQDPSGDGEGPSLTGGAWEHHCRVGNWLVMSVLPRLGGALLRRRALGC